MNKQAFFPLLFLLAIGVFFSFKMIADKKEMLAEYGQSEVSIEPYKQDENQKLTKSQAIQETITRVIKDGHYSPKNINDEFSKKVYEKYLEMTDFGKLFFLESDINEFDVYEEQIDDQIFTAKTNLPDLVTARIKQRMKEAESYYKEALKAPFTFDGNEEIELDGKKLTWCKDQADLKNRWYVNMKFRTLSRLTELKDEQKAIAEKKVKLKTDTLWSNAELEAKARANVEKSLANYFKRLNKISDQDRFATYINSICHVVDPHTDFFPPKDKQRFDEEMSGSFIGIGAVLQSDGANCVIKQIVAGSPCWKDGRLKVNDVIQKVAQGADEPVDISGWDTDDIVQIIRGKEGTIVKLTIKHLNGNTEIISIKRGKVELENTFAKSAVIKVGTMQIGYILLPEFYADFNSSNGRRCAVDMRKEIEKLKNENVNGIIIDLRFNGGGSLNDVVEIGGMFVDKGPIVQVKSKDAPAQALNDRESGVLYDGPLAIMINQGSASASEILAAAMQDYKRAIIIGTTSFGKGTVQRVFPLEDFYQGDASLLPFGSIKLTLQKFYRINGGSTQLKGVTPDILLPDPYEYLEIGERKDSNSLAWDQVAKADYKPIKSNVDFLQLNELSQKRVASNQNFSLITQNALRMKKQNEINRYPLNEKKYQAQIKENKDISKKLEDLDKDKKLITLVNIKADLPQIQIDTTSRNKNEEWLKTLRKDPYVAEASNVILDWIKQSKGETVGKVVNPKN